MRKSGDKFESVEICYQLDANDMAAFQTYWWRKKSKLRPWMLIILLTILVSFPQASLLPGHPLTFLYSAGIPFVIISAFAVWFVPVAAKMRAKSVPGFLDQRSIRIDTAYIAEKTSVTETKLEWSRIQAVEEGERCLYFFINNQYALLLPERAFSSPAEMQTFLDRSKRYWEAVKAGRVVPADDADIWPPPPHTGA